MPKNWRRGKSKNNAVTKSNTIVGKLQADYLILGTWDAVAVKYKITKAMAYRVAHGYEPHKSTIRTALGLPPLALGPVCPVHGKVCAIQHRPPDPARPARPRPGWGRKPLNVIHKENTLTW